MTSLCPKTGDTLADILINYRWNLKAMGWKQIIFTAFSSFDRFAVKKIYIFLWEKCLNSHLADVCVKNSFGICDVCVKISCAICELKFSLGRRCTKEMVRSTIEYALGEISWRLQLLIEADVPLARSEPSDLEKTNWERRFRHAGYGYFIYVYEGKKKLQLNFRSNILLKRFPHRAFRL